MDNLATARSNLREQLAVARRKHTWVVSWLYVGTFGSFVGYSAAFPLLVETQFGGRAVSLAFLCPLVGSLARPLGGKLGDRLGGSRVTFATFLITAGAALGALSALRAGGFVPFVACCLLLFVTSGVGNGSTYRIVPEIFRAPRDAAAVLGLTSAVGALGGFFVPQLLAASVRATGAPTSAFALFVAFYGSCLAITWWHYLRPEARRSIERGAHASEAADTT